MTNLSRCDIAFDDLGHVAVEQGLAAGDGNGGRAAFVDRVHALLIGQALVQDLVGIIDLAAAGAGQVAAEQRLQHQHQRIFLARQMLLDDIGADLGGLAERKTHDLSPQLGGKAELDMFLLAVHLFDFDVFDLAQRLDHMPHQFFRGARRRRSGRPRPCRAPIRASTRCRH